MTAIQKHQAMAATSISAVQAPRASQVLGKTAAAGTTGASMSSKAAGLAAAMGGSSTAATSTTPSTTASDDITSNDFLTLLLSELKNQDPTQPTDPNAYITQMVGVNSLQQLISINQEIG